MDENNNKVNKKKESNGYGKLIIKSIVAIIIVSIVAFIFFMVSAMNTVGSVISGDNPQDSIPSISDVTKPDTSSDEKDKNKPTVNNNANNTNKKIGDTIKTDKFNITVNNIKFTDKGYSGIIKPKDGNKFCLIDITLENISNDTQTVSSLLMFEVRDKEGREMPHSFSAGSEGLNGTIFAGKKMTGTYGVETPQDVSELELMFKDGAFSQDPIFIKLQ